MACEPFVSIVISHLMYNLVSVQALKDALDTVDKARKAALAQNALKAVDELLAAGVRPLVVKVIDAGSNAKVLFESKTECLSGCVMLVWISGAEPGSQVVQDQGAPDKRVPGVG